MPPLIDLSGQKFNRLVVICRSNTNTAAGQPKWLCVCECGREVHATSFDLKQNKQKSCGCLRAETSRANGKATSTTHGHSRAGKNGQGSPEYLSWRSMVQRCTDPNATGYERYGGAGIKVCDRWKDNFANFLADMGSRPAGVNGRRSAYTLDRVDPFGNYEPSNCRWATWQQQNTNTRKRRS